MVGVAIFDIDGTLIDSVDQHAQSWKDAFRDHGVDVGLDDVRRQIGKGADQLLPVFLSESQRDRMGGAIAAREAEIFKARYANDLRPFANVRALFERLQQNGVKRVLASSGKPDDVARSEQVARITDLVDLVVTSKDVENSKPAPDIIEAVLKRLAPTPATDCVFIGDTPYDAEAAVRAGVKSIGLLSGCFDEDALKAAGCASVYADIQDVFRGYDSIWPTTAP